jgi:hypothetical protein
LDRRLFFGEQVFEKGIEIAGDFHAKMQPSQKGRAENIIGVLSPALESESPGGRLLKIYSFLSAPSVAS